MAVYTVHVPEGLADELRRADRTVFVREGFNGWALLFGSLFLLRHRLWIAFVLWLAVACGITAFGWVFHPPAGPLVALMVLMHLFLGVEGNDLRRWRLERRRFAMADVVTGQRSGDAELAYFLRRPSEAANPAPAPRQRPARDVMPAVIGMFQDQDRP